MTDEIGAAYKCGNYTQNERDRCPYCGAEQREKDRPIATTISVTCPGWTGENNG